MLRYSEQEYQTRTRRWNCGEMVNTDAARKTAQRLDSPAGAASSLNRAGATAVPDGVGKLSDGFNAHKENAPAVQSASEKSTAQSARFKLKAPEIPERDVLATVLAALQAHPRVAMVHRMNSGAYKTATGQFVRFGFPGCSDLIGMLRDGRFLAVECKRKGKSATEAQLSFLRVVDDFGGMAFVAWSADDVRKALG
jgi:hypothetical protein